IHYLSVVRCPSSFVLRACTYTRPPLTCQTCPVTKLACGETQNSTTLATSSGVPQRSTSDSATARACQYSLALSPHRVLIQPGATQFTRTSGANDRAALRV